MPIVSFMTSTASTFELPSKWIPMKSKDTFKAVSLAAGTPEYNDVASHITASGRQIVEVLL